MVGSAVYGLCMGAAIALLRALLPHAVADGIWTGFFAVQLAIGARVTWERTRLPLVTVAMALGSAILLGAFGAALNGYSTDVVVRTWPLPSIVLSAVGPVCFAIESRVHRAEWQAWRRHMEDASAIDILLMRHIPDLQQEMASPIPKA